MSVMEIKDIAEVTWLELIEEAKAGNIEAAEKILREYVGSIESVQELSNPESSCGVIPFPIAQYVAQCFNQILAGVSSEKALNLARKRGEKKQKHAHDLEAIAATYWILIRAGWNPEKAKEAIREWGQLGIGADRVTTSRAIKIPAYQAFEFPKLIPTEELERRAAPYMEKLQALLA